MSLKQLEEAIRLYPSNVRIQETFDAFKKQTVCIPRKQLEDKLKFYEKQFKQVEGTFLGTPLGAKIQLLKELLKE